MIENNRTNHEGKGKTGRQQLSPPEILNVNLKAKNIDHAKWAAKHLIRNLEILAALEKTDPRYEVYKEAALKDKHNVDLYLQTVL